MFFEFVLTVLKPAAYYFYLFESEAKFLVDSKTVPPRFERQTLGRGSFLN